MPRGDYGPGGRWIHDRAHRIMRKSTRGTDKGIAYAVATQQAHSVDKSPKSFRTPPGVRTAKRKYPHPKEYRKTAAAQRTYLGDFVSGMNPVGATVLEHGLEDVKRGASKEEQNKRRMAATAGGLLGGALLVPLLAGGVAGGVRGMMRAPHVRSALRGAVHGATMPFRKIGEGIRVRKTMAKIEQGVKLDDKDVKTMRGVASSLAPGPLRRDVMKKLDPTFDKVTAKDMNSLLGLVPRDLQVKGARHIGERGAERALAGLGVLGLGTTIGGANAFVQYGRGQDLAAKHSLGKKASVMFTNPIGGQGGDPLHQLNFLLGQEARLNKMAVSMSAVPTTPTVNTSLTPQPMPTGGEGLTSIPKPKFTPGKLGKPGQYSKSHTAAAGPTTGLGATAKNTPPPVARM